MNTITNNKDTGRNVTFGYDQLKRLTSAQSQATSGADCWGQTVPSGGYDRYGNLLAINSSQCSSPALSLSVSAKNRITNTSFTYDNAGNETFDGVLNYAWNAENHLTSTNGVNYTYDGDLHRVEKRVAQDSPFKSCGFSFRSIGSVAGAGSADRRGCGLRLFLGRANRSNSLCADRSEETRTTKPVVRATGFSIRSTSFRPMGKADSSRRAAKPQRRNAATPQLQSTEVALPSGSCATRSGSCYQAPRRQCWTGGAGKQRCGSAAPTSPSQGAPQK